MTWRCVVGAAIAVFVCQLPRPVFAQPSVSNAQAAANPLQVTNVTTDDRGAVTIQLSNVGSEVITGWVIIVAHSPEAEVASTRDCYTSFISEPRCLKPGESTHTSLAAGPHGGLGPPSVEVAATILDHGRVIGSQMEAAHLLDARTRAGLAIDRLVQTFSRSLGGAESVRPSASLAEALQSAAVKDQDRALNAVATETTRILNEATEADKTGVGFRLLRNIGNFASRLLTQGEISGFRRVDFANFLERAQAVHARHAPNGDAQ